jgi:hypothetical protein
MAAQAQKKHGLMWKTMHVTLAIATVAITQFSQKVDSCGSTNAFTIVSRETPKDHVGDMAQL